MRLPVAGPGRTVVGVAIAVPEPYRRELHDARERFGDPEARNIVPHVTLIGPTAVADDRLDDLDARLARLAAEHDSFRVRLHGTQTFRPVSPVVFLALEEGAAQCAQLERELRADVLPVEPLFPYHPHVTVAHDVDDDALDAAQAHMAGYDARFEVTHLHRFVHDGRAWRSARQFAFGVSATADAATRVRT